MNPAIAHLTVRAQKSLLKQEAKWRAEGSWGDWSEVPQREIDRLIVKLGSVGWVRDVKVVYRNRVFSVLVRGVFVPWSANCNPQDKQGITHAAVASLSGIRPTWHEMQRIKDSLFGHDKTAVEIYPPRRDVVDGADLFHLWILPEDLPYGLKK